MHRLGIVSAASVLTLMTGACASLQEAADRAEAKKQQEEEGGLPAAAPEVAATSVEAEVNGTKGAASPAPQAGPEVAAVAPPAPAPSPVPPLPGPGLGISQDELIRAIAADEFEIEAFSEELLPDGRRVMAASFPETTNRQVLYVAMFGEQSEPHTVRVDFIPANAEIAEARAVGAALDRLMETLFPDWPEADQWPEVAGSRAWDEAVKLLRQNPDQPQAPIFETQRDNITLAALAQPPAVVNYVFTTQESCRPGSAEGFYEGYLSCR